MTKTYDCYILVNKNQSTVFNTVSEAIESYNKQCKDDSKPCIYGIIYYFDKDGLLHMNPAAKLNENKEFEPIK